MNDSQPRTFSLIFILICALTVVNLVSGFIAAQGIDQSPWGFDDDYNSDIAIRNPPPNVTISRTIEINWQISKMDEDTLKCEVYYSPDAGITWIPAIPPDPNGSPQPKNGTDWMYWNTTEVPDGRYLLQVTCSDEYITERETINGFFWINNSGNPLPPPVDTPVEVKVSEWNLRLDQRGHIKLKTTLNQTEISPAEVLIAVKVEILNGYEEYIQFEDVSTNSLFFKVKYWTVPTSDHHDAIVTAYDSFGAEHVIYIQFSFVHWRTYASFTSFFMLLAIFTWKRYPLGRG